MCSFNEGLCSDEHTEPALLSYTLKGRLCAGC